MSNSALRIFVYGTLRRACSTGAHQRFLSAAQFIAPARLQAELYRVGYYPAVSLSCTHSWVQGEVYELPSAEALALLDDYEECSATPSPDDEYKRERVQVEHADGEREWVWTYVYQRSTAALPLIASGDFLADIAS